MLSVMWMFAGEPSMPVMYWCTMPVPYWCTVLFLYCELCTVLLLYWCTVLFLYCELYTVLVLYWCTVLFLYCELYTVLVLYWCTVLFLYCELCTVLVLYWCTVLFLYYELCTVYCAGVVLMYCTISVLCQCVLCQCVLCRCCTDVQLLYCTGLGRCMDRVSLWQQWRVKNTRSLHPMLRTFVTWSLHSLKVSRQGQNMSLPCKTTRHPLHLQVCDFIPTLYLARITFFVL